MDLERLAAALERLAARVAALEHAIAAWPPPPPIPVSDATFVRAVAAAVGRSAFSARELINHATVDANLQAALSGVTSAKRIGRRLQRLAGHDVGGLRLCRVDRDHDGLIWSVQVVDLQAGVWPDADRGA